MSMSNEKIHRFTLRMKPGVYQRLRKKVYETHRPMNDIILEFIESALGHPDGNPPPSESKFLDGVLEFNPNLRVLVSCFEHLDLLAVVKTNPFHEDYALIFKSGTKLSENVREQYSGVELIDFLVLPTSTEVPPDSYWKSIAVSGIIYWWTDTETKEAITHLFESWGA